MGDDGGGASWDELTRLEKSGDLGGGKEVGPLAIPATKGKLKKWGLGGASKFYLPPKNGDYTVVGIFDLHGFWYDPDLFKAQLNAVEWLQPDAVVFGGDEHDYSDISRWSKVKLRRMHFNDIYNSIKDENDHVCNKFWAPMRKIVGSDTIVIGMDSNHGQRIREQMSDDLHEADRLMREWMRVDEYLDHFANRAGVYIAEDFLVSHGSSTAMHAAKAEFVSSGVSGWSGHVHTISLHAERPLPEKGIAHVHTKAPASCRLDYDYGPGHAGLARWHRGMLVMTMNAQNHHDHWTDICVYNGTSLLVRGRRFYP